MTCRETTGNSRLFPDVRVNGGSVFGVPLLVSAGCPDDKLILVDADGLLVTDAGVSLDVAVHSAFQFDSAPSAGATNVVSLWQSGALGIKIQRYITWRLAWTDA